MKTLQIHGVDPEGEKYRLNEMRGDNAAVLGASDEDCARLRAELHSRLTTMRMYWQRQYPHDVIQIVEVSRWA